jgi:tetratricopeptide (TPR) repeat protein
VNCVVATIALVLRLLLDILLILLSLCAIHTHVLCLFVVVVTTTALSDYEHALVLDPTEVQVYLMKGNALSVLDQHQDALMTYKKALALKPSEIGKCVILQHTLRHWSRYT